MIEGWWDGPLLGLAFTADGADPLEAQPTGCAIIEVAPDGTRAGGRAGRIDPDNGTPVAPAMLAIRDLLVENLRRKPAPLPLVVFDAPFAWCLFLRSLERHDLHLPNGQPIVDPLVLYRQRRPDAADLAVVAGGCGIDAGYERDGDTYTSGGPLRAALAAVAAARSLVRHLAERDPVAVAFPGFHRRQRELFADWRGSQRRSEVGEWPAGRLALDPDRGYGPQEAAHG